MLRTEPVLEATSLWGDTVLDVAVVDDEAEIARHELSPAETRWLESGGTKIRLRYVARARFRDPSLWAKLDYTWINTLLLAFFAHAVGIASFVAMPELESRLAEGLPAIANRIAELRLNRETKKREEAPSRGGAKAIGTEGRSGKKEELRRKHGRTAVLGDPSEKDLASQTLATMFGGRLGGVFGPGGSGGELERAVGEVTGARIGDAVGRGGLAPRGDGPGGGGLSPRPFGLGPLETPGRAGGNDDYGSAGRGLRKSDRGDVTISINTPIIRGSLEKDVIRRVIKDHMEQIRYCYERELVRTPGLFGRVATEFVIGADGTVTSVKIKESTMNNAEVPRCVAARIRAWIFPKPNGGGVVVVKYPFIFKTSG